MPYLQLDVPNSYPVDVKRRLARRMGEIYARIMETTPNIVSVAIRELPEGSLWACSEEDPEPGAILMCEVRRGRTPEQRAAVAQALIETCVEMLGLRSDRLPVEFTQHAGDEMYRAGRGWARDWTPAEARTANARTR
jgi:phenylpyruvate tautomerase PptA (4-oxalocrotonate tautomerase family)